MCIMECGYQTFGISGIYLAATYCPDLSIHKLPEIPITEEDGNVMFDWIRGFTTWIRFRANIRLLQNLFYQP